MSNAQVLVVEDEKIVAKALQNELRGLGYYVPEVAATGEEALEKVERTHPDVVLMDIVLKGSMDGIETARRVRDRFDVPVVYLSAYEDDDTLVRARSTEPFGYLLKPYEEKELYTTIEMALYKHRMEQRLKESHRWLGATLRGISDAVIATDGRHYVQFLNPVAERLSAWTQAEAIGQDLPSICRLTTPDAAEALTEAAHRAIHEGVSVPLPGDCTLVGRDGAGTPVEGTVAPILDDEGNFTGLVVVLRDVSERRHVERLQRQSEEHLRHSQKMEAVSRLAGGVAHDFNNLLTAILGNSSLVMSSLTRTDPNLERMVQVESAALRAAELVKQLLGFSGRRSLWLEPTSLNDVTDDCVDMLRRTCDLKIGVEFDQHQDLWPVRADRAQLAEVVMNLCLNALDAMPEGGRLQLTTENVRVPEDYLLSHLEAHPGEYVRLRVSDTGCGMSPETQARIFEPFFTTKDPGKGTGLGLALVFGIVEEHHGWVECVSDLGVGSRFDVYFPRYWQAPLGPPPEMTVRTPRTVAETILLADDEAMIRDLGQTILQRCGYQVLLAEDGLQAVEIFQREKHRIDLVILDLTMPRLSGDDAFRRMVEMSGEVRVLFSSGYFAEDVPTGTEHVLGFLSKPYRHDDLIRTVRAALDQAKDVAARRNGRG